MTMRTKTWIPLKLLPFARNLVFLYSHLITKSKKNTDFLVLFIIHLGNSATFSNVEKFSCRGENAEGKGVRLYSAEVGNVTEGKDPVWLSSNHLNYFFDKIIT